MKIFDLLKSSPICAKRSKYESRALDKHVIASNEAASINKIEGAKQSDQCSNTGKIASKCLIVDRVPNFMSRNDVKKIIHSSQFTVHSSQLTVHPLLFAVHHGPLSPSQNY